MIYSHGAFTVRTLSAVLLATSLQTFAQEAADEPTIVVSASRSAQVLTEALPHTTLIDRDTIDKSPAADVVELLKMQAGVSVTSSGTQGALAGVRIRGGETSHTLILLDGVPMNSLSAGSHASLEQMPLSSIERIEIVRGNVSALYGSQAMGGVIQLFSRKPNGNDATVRVAAGSHGQRQASVQVRGGNDVVQATVGISHDELKAVSAMNPAQTTVNPDKDAYKNDSANAHIRYRPNAANEFGLRFLESRGRNQYDSPFAASNTSQQFNTTRVQNISLYANNQINPNWKSNLRVSQLTDRIIDRFDEPSLWSNGQAMYQTRTQEAAWQNNLFSRWGEFVAGVSLKRQKLSSDTAYDTTQRTTRSAWLGYTLNQNRHHLQLNGRLDGLSDLGTEYAAAINYGFDVSDKVKLLAGYSNGYAAPDFAQLYYPNYGNPLLKTEHATQTHVGIQFDNDTFGGRLTAFDNRSRDKIATDPVTYKPLNLNKAQAQGLEWHGWYNAHGWRFESGLTLQSVKNSTTGERLIRQPRILASLGVGKTWGKWHGQLNWQAQGNSTDTQHTRVAGYGVLNAALSYAPQSNLKLALSVGNLFNRHYQTLYGYNSMPRNVLLSLHYQPKW
ncbi:MAG: TonB-dependent receptor domain-containing protein [Formosimonas sp.]